MKNKIALASAFVAASGLATAEIVINDFLSFEGFVDMSYSHTDIDSDIADIDGSDNSFAIDQVEIDWLFDFDTVTAQIDVAYEGSEAGDDDDDVEIEQAFATYHFDNGGAITAGRYASMLGFEAFEPTGLYQYSFAYDMGIADVSVLPLYAQGVKFTHESDTTFFGISLQDEAFDVDGDRLGGSGDSSWAAEIAGAYYMENGLSFFLGGTYEDADGDGTDTGAEDADAYAINAYVTFETGAWIFAAEVNYGEFDGGQVLGAAAPVVDPYITGAADEEVIQALIMANYAYSDQGSITGRITYADHEVDVARGLVEGSEDADFIKYTLAHGWAFTDNLSLVTEVSFVDGELVDEDYEALVGAVELIFAF